jgi:ferredoxin
MEKSERRSSNRAHEEPTEGELHMANKITDDCIACGACEPECPNGAISQGGDLFVIDASKCDECASTGGDSACMAVCPTDAVVKA